jgi:hypothetical protein
VARHAAVVLCLPSIGDLLISCTIAWLLADIDDATGLWVWPAADTLNSLMHRPAVPQDEATSLGLHTCGLKSLLFEPGPLLRILAHLLIIKLVLIHFAVFKAKMTAELLVKVVGLRPAGKCRITFLDIPQRHHALYALSTVVEVRLVRMKPDVLLAGEETIPRLLRWHVD